jgi:hypothetical protein
MYINIDLDNLRNMTRVTMLFQCLFLEGGWGHLLIFLRIPPYFFRGRGKILHRERREKIEKCNKFSLFDKKYPLFFETWNRHCYSNLLYYSHWLCKVVFVPHAHTQGEGIYIITRATTVIQNCDQNCILMKFSFHYISSV